jgi:DNA polymerase III delta subunit
MAYFLQWLNKFPERKRLVYICGKERLLVNEVLKAEMASRNVSDLGLIKLDGAKDSIVNIDTELKQYGNNNRLILLKNADQIKDFSFVIKWTNLTHMRKTSLICVGNEVFPQTKEDRYRPFIEKRDSGKFIECKELSLEQTLELIAMKGSFTHDARNALYVACGGNLSKILNEIEKLNYLGKTITKELVDEFVNVSINDNFVNKLFERTYTLDMVSLIQEKDIPLIIAGIEYYLLNMLLIIKYRSNDRGFKDIASISGVPLFLVNKLFFLCKGVSEATILRRIKLLANLDVSYRKGNIVGALERFLILW